MARAKLTETKEDLLNDSGAVLWSFVKGEQLEFPIVLNFLTDITVPGYAFEAVVIEALNVANQTAKPTAIKPGGVQTTLTVRVPSVNGTWNSNTSYNTEAIVLYANAYYRFLGGTNYQSSTPPNLDPLWEETTINRVYVQFPSTLGSTWEVAPAVNFNVYGFFELRVTEPTNPVFIKTWKPIRGMVELLFSPTDLVPG